MTVKIFYCYAHEDRKLREGLEIHLASLKQQKLITKWFDGDINGGKEWSKEIINNLNTADIILLLISPDFMNSDYCYSIEMKRALERHENGTARVIPIILRHGDYEGALFTHLQALPTDAVPVIDGKWRNKDQAFSEIAKGIRKVVKELLSEQWLDEGNIFFYRQQYKEALMAFEEAICLDPTNALAYVGKGETFNQLASPGFSFRGEYLKAVAAFEKAIECDPTNSHAYEGKGTALFHIAPRNTDVLSAYEQAIRFDPQNVAAYIGQGKVFMSLDRYEEALGAFEKAIDIAILPNQDAYEGKKEVLTFLGRYERHYLHLSSSFKNFRIIVAMPIVPKERHSIISNAIKRLLTLTTKLFLLVLNPLPAM